MKAGSFNIHEYLERLNENAEAGNLASKDKEGILIPDENKKSYDWLKREYDKSKTEVKVEIKMGGAKFEPGYELQTDLKSVKDFKPGMFGDVKTSDNEGAKKEKKDTAQTQAEQEGDKPEGEKKAEKSTGEEKPKKSEVSAKVKTAEESEKKPKKKEEDKEDDKS